MGSWQGHALASRAGQAPAVGHTTQQLRVGMVTTEHSTWRHSPTWALSKSKLYSHGDSGVWYGEIAWTPDVLGQCHEHSNERCHSTSINVSLGGASHPSDPGHDHASDIRGRMYNCLVWCLSSTPMVASNEILPHSPAKHTAPPQRQLSKKLCTSLQHIPARCIDLG
jgi:hypothetical protein